MEPALVEPHLSVRTFAGLKKYFGERFDESVFPSAVRAAGLPPEYLDDNEHWVSAEFAYALSRALVAQIGETGDERWSDPAWQHWHAAGRLAMERDVFGPLLTLARVLGSPGAVFRGISSVTRYVNKMSTFELESQGRGLTVLSVRAASAALPDRPEYCWSRIGVFEAVPTIWGLPLATVEHRRCAHHETEPADECQYVIRYRERAWHGMARTVALTACLGAAGALAGRWLGGVPLGVAAGIFASATVDMWLRHRSARSTRLQDARILQQTLLESERAVERLRNEQLRLQRLLLANQKISGYLNPEIVNEIMDKPERALVLGGRNVHAAVLFLDIVGYTTRSEGRPPAQVVDELNRFFGVVDPVLSAHDGVLDKRIGDAVMAVFVDRGGEPPETRALACAIDILKATAELESPESAQQAQQAPPSGALRIRVGVSAGSLVQGNLGSPLRYEYTVIGDVVNLAARLEEAAKPGHVLTLGELRSHIPASGEVVETRRMAIRGRAASAEVIELRPR